MYVAILGGNSRRTYRPHVGSFNASFNKTIEKDILNTGILKIPTDDSPQAPFVNLQTRIYQIAAQSSKGCQWVGHRPTEGRWRTRTRIKPSRRQI